MSLCVAGVCGRRSAKASYEGLDYTTSRLSEQYGQMCGRIIGYQSGSPDAFAGINHLIDSYYMDGISITQGRPQQHIWSFVGGLDEMTIFSNYFCESAITQWYHTLNYFYPNSDPLLDGQGYGPTSSCCTFNSPPWFNVRLPFPATDDIEVRICGDQGIGNEDTPIQLIELYVK